MYQNKDLFDLSNFRKDSKYYCGDSKKVSGKMKDEYGETVICEFIGLKSKIYSICDINDYEKSIHKGHNSYIRYDEICNISIHIYLKYWRWVDIRNCDDKRLQTFDGITTYPYGTNAFKVCESEMLNNKRFILWKIIIKRC